MTNAVRRSGGPLSKELVMSVELLRPKRVMEILDISRTTLHRWAQSGRLKPVLLPTDGSRQFRRYRREDVMRIAEVDDASESTGG